MSQPPTSSPLTNSWGIVGQLEIARQLLADARVGQDVDRRVGGAERVERGDRAGAEAAHRLLRAALHEEDDFVLGDRLGISSRMGLVVSLTVYSALVTRDRAWMGPPMSAPNTA